MSKATQRDPTGFTLTEVMVVVAIMGVVMAMTLASFRSYLQEQRLRLTANELASLLGTGQSIATKQSGTCRIKLQSGTGAIFGADTSLSGNVCTNSNLARANLYLTATTNLSVSGDTTYTYTEFGTLDGAASLTTLLSSTATPWVWCISVSSPTGLVRIGTKDSRVNNAACNYRRG